MSLYVALIILLVSLCKTSSAQTDAAAIIQPSVQANERDWAAAPHYDYREQEKTKDGTRTYDELMIEGSRYERLISINGRPLSPDMEAKERRKLQAEVVKRKNETPDQRRRRIARYEADRKRDHLLMDEMTRAFRFNVTGQQTIDGREVYVLNAVPRPGYNPPSRDAQVLTGMNGTLWIDTENYQWVKVEAHVIHPVSISGFLARVEPGTEFELEKMPVADDVWMPKHFAMKARAKVLFLFSHQQQQDETFFDYQPAGQAGENSALSRHVSKALPHVRR